MWGGRLLYDGDLVLGEAVEVVDQPVDPLRLRRMASICRWMAVLTWAVLGPESCGGSTGGEKFEGGLAFSRIRRILEVACIG